MNQEYLEFVKALRPIDDIFMKVIFNDQHPVFIHYIIPSSNIPAPVPAGTPPALSPRILPG